MNELVRDDAAIRLFCSFRAEGRLYGIDAAQVREVSTQVSCTPVPQAPAAIRGLTNLRSRIYLVIDVRSMLGLAPVDCTSGSRLIVLKSHVAEDLGILVEHGGDIVSVNAEQIENAARIEDKAIDSCGGRLPPVTAGVCKLETELMTIIDSTRLVEAVKVLMA